MGLSTILSVAARPFRPTPLPRRFPLAPVAASAHPLAYPFEPLPRIALFGWTLNAPAPAQFFSALDPSAIDLFAPEAIAAPIEILRVLAGARRRRLLSLASLSHPLLVFTDLFSGVLTERDRDSLWDDFGLPLFEQWRGWEGELLAAECEAHDGLHIQAGEAAFDLDPVTGELLLTSFASTDARAVRLPTGVHGHIETSPCPCRNPSPRLKPRPLPADQ